MNVVLISFSLFWVFVSYSSSSWNLMFYFSDLTSSFMASIAFWAYWMVSSILVLASSAFFDSVTATSFSFLTSFLSSKTDDSAFCRSITIYWSFSSTLPCKVAISSLSSLTLSCSCPRDVRRKFLLSSISRSVLASSKSFSVTFARSYPISESFSWVCRVMAAAIPSAAASLVAISATFSA